MKSLPATTGSIAAALALAGSLLLATPAAAAPAVTVKGEIQCINNASPVGVWVEAESSTSGWAKTEVPVKLLGHAKVAYTYTLNKGGRYKVHVGCGGSSKKWGMTLKSGYLSGSTNNLACNDVHPALQSAWGKIPKKALPPAIAKKFDLARGIKFQTCGKA